MDKPRISYSDIRGYSEVYPVAKTLLFLVPGITQDSRDNSSFKNRPLDMQCFCVIRQHSRGSGMSNWANWWLGGYVGDYLVKSFHLAVFQKYNRCEVETLHVDLYSMVWGWC